MSIRYSPISDLLDGSAPNLPFIEQMLVDYCADPSSTPAPWREYLERLAQEEHEYRKGNGKFRSLPSFFPSTIFNPSNPLDSSNLPRAEQEIKDRSMGGLSDRANRTISGSLNIVNLQDRVDQMIRAYRVRGHVMAHTDPLAMPQPYQPELDPSFYGFTHADMDRPFSTRTIYGPDVSTLREIVDRLQNTYCRSIGVQFMHIDSIRVRHWIQNRVEGSENRIRLTRSEQLRILTRLTDAVIFEEFIRKKYVGAKRFSLEGAESLIPLLDLAIEKAGQEGVREIVLGMAHRGRLNVLANIMGKSPGELFREFEDRHPQVNVGHGDVKYHLGYSSDWITADGRKIHLSLAFNPSHLEFVNPVVQGRVRAKQDRYCDQERHRGLALLIHGDASFAGEGIVQETLNLSELPGYSTGGTIHVIVNNQIGFTTLPQEGRSSLYASGVGKMLQIPIFQVNGEDPEAVAQVVQLAMDFRRDFRRDVIIEMYCFRRWGHNEADEPAFTQPMMVRQINQRPSVRESYLERLLALNEVTRDEAELIAEQRRQRLEEELTKTRREDYYPVCSMLQGIWEGYYGGPATGYGGSVQHVPEVETGVDHQQLTELLEKLATVPSDFHVHPTLARGLAARRDMAHGQHPLDWSAAEALALATLSTEGYRVRLSGQDTQRGTFSQRHAVLHDQQDGRQYMPLANLSPNQAPIDIINSPLSELGVLGFEYGYSLDWPDGLVVWEAQFGDFVNAAQVMVDQFIATAELKWQRLSGLVLLLPHGLEGQGPEHSSSRIERFLSLAAEDNIQIVYPSTPAQYFHVLRRQVLRKWRKPLVIITPKSMLRLPEAVSPLDEFTPGMGSFRRIIPDQKSPTTPQQRITEVKKIILCSGKVYYDLVQHRQTHPHEEVSIIRLDQVYPLFDEELQAVLSQYSATTPVCWVQEEPRNMSVWPFLRARFGDRLFDRWPLFGITRPEAASPATGSAASHKLEQQTLLERAFEETPGRLESLQTWSDFQI